MLHRHTNKQTIYFPFTEIYKMVQFNYFNYMKKNYLSVLISMPPDIRSFTKTKHKKMKENLTKMNS